MADLPLMTQMESPSLTWSWGAAPAGSSKAGGGCFSRLRQRTTAGGAALSSATMTLNGGRSAGVGAQHRPINCQVAIGAASGRARRSPWAPMRCRMSRPDRPAHGS